MKKFLLYFFGTCVALGIILSTIFATLPAYSMMGKGFLASLSLGNYDQAYATLSDDLKKQYSFEDFKAKVIALGLNKYKTVEWAKELENKKTGRGYVMGIVVTQPDPTTNRTKRIPIEIEFITVSTGNSFLDKGYRISAISMLKSDSNKPLEPVNTPAPAQ